MAKNHFYRFKGDETCRRIVSLFIFLIILSALVAGNVLGTIGLTVPGTVVLNVVTAYFAANFIFTVFELEFYDPGYVIQQQDIVYIEVCTKCEMGRPSRAHHCSVCKKCVRKYDHHCDVFNECIGAWTLPYFFKFFASATILLLYGLIFHVITVVLSLSAYEFISYVMIIASGLLLCVVVGSAIALVWKPAFRDITELEELDFAGTAFPPREGAARRCLGRFWGLGIFLIGWKFNVLD